MTNPPSVPRRFTSLWPLLLGLIALLPFLSQYRYFQQLFWFGDEFPLMNEIDTMPFSHWLWFPFVENTIPLFKLLWGGAVLVGSGAYIDVLWATWLIHAAITGLMALWMRRCGFGWGSVLLLATLFGWSASQVETLTWTVQISSQLCTLFFVAAALMMPAVPAEKIGAGRVIILVLFITASAWCFARGLLTGPVLGLTLLLPLPWKAGSKQWILAAICVLPALATGILVLKNSAENSRHLASELPHLAAVLRFTLCYLGGCPFLPYLESTAHASPFDSPVGTVVLVGCFKLLVIVAGWRWATPNQRRLLLPALLLELTYAALLGMGRWEGDWHYAMGSRYQYNSLLCTAPFLGVVLTRAFNHPRFSARRQFAAMAAITALLGAYSFYGWSCEMPIWGEWRGLRNRHLLVHPKIVPPGNDVVALPTFPNWRAKQLVDKYNLH